MRRITREHFNFNPSFYSYIHTHEEFKNNRDLKLITKTFLFTKECFLSNPIILSLLFTILFELNFYTFFQDHPANRSRVGRYEETIQSATFIESTSFDNASKSTETKPRIIPSHDFHLLCASCSRDSTRSYISSWRRVECVVIPPSVSGLILGSNLE